MQSSMTPFRSVLLADAVVSGFATATVLVLAGLVADWFDLSVAAVVVIGIALLGHVALLVVGVVSPDRAEAVTRYAVVANAAWVVAAGVVLVAGWLDSGPAWALGLVSLVVGGFAVAQWQALRADQATAASTTSPRTGSR